MAEQQTLFGEQEIVAENQHLQGDIKKELGINESLGFYFAGTREATSEDYGDFVICQGLKVDVTSASVDALLETSLAYSFIPNVLLSNKLTEGSFAQGELYRIEKTWEKGQKFKDGTKAKGYGFTLYHQNVDPLVKKQLADIYASRINPLKAAETPVEGDEAPAVNTPAV